MIRWAVAGGLVLWAGSALALTALPGFRAVDLTNRLRPYATGSSGAARTIRGTTWTGTRAVLRPLAEAVVQWLAARSGGDGALRARLGRIGADEDAANFRIRQARDALVGLAAGAALAAALRPTPLVAGLLVALPATVGALLPEHRVRTADERLRAQLLAELPVVAEQLGMLLGSGYSLGAAVARLAERGSGAMASELARVTNRIRQGLSEVDALRECADRVDLPGLDRLVSVLALNWEAADLGGLVSSEARAIRREVHRGQVELIDRRAQQVWIPVTVATLLPGVVFMAVPFVDAMSRITGR